MEGSGSVQINTDPNPDPRGPKKYGSGLKIGRNLRKSSIFINLMNYYNTGTVPIHQHIIFIGHKCPGRIRILSDP
jgi:hypothetical protein